jgi:hypothetical protein
MSGRGFEVECFDFKIFGIPSGFARFDFAFAWILLSATCLGANLLSYPPMRTIKCGMASRYSTRP